MDEAREAANWEIASNVLAMLQKCQSEGARNIPFNADAWNLVKQREIAAERLAKQERDARERQAVLNDPAKLAELRAQKIAAWNAFRANVR